MIYKVSYVVIGGDHPGAILNQDHLPKSGEIITLGTDQFEVLEVADLIPPRGDFAYIHATVRPLQS
jgi:hypothetical protein